MIAAESDEVRQLRSKYQSKLATAKELFPDWTDEDVLYAIHDANGDVEVAIVRMSEGKPALSSCPPRVWGSYPHSLVRPLVLRRLTRKVDLAYVHAYRSRAAVGRCQDEEGQEGGKGRSCTRRPRRVGVAARRFRRSRSWWFRCVFSRL